MRRLLPWLLIPWSTACALHGDAGFEEGDRLFRMGRYHEAYQSYLSIEEGGTELQNRRDKAYFLSLLESAETAIHVNRIERALALLDHAASLHPDHPRIAALRHHAQRRRAVQLADAGEELLDNGTPRAAEAVFREAVTWDPNNESALRGLDESTRRSRIKDQRGEDLYFEGLGYLEEGLSLRAFTAFMHATDLLGEDSRAADHFDLMSRELGQDGLRRGRVAFADGDLGGAWMALTDAAHLDPSNPEILDLRQQVLDRIEAERLLVEADLNVRGGRVDRAEELFARVLELTGDVHGHQVAEMQSKAIQERARRQYALARACELDFQFVRAAGIYQQILEETEGYGFEELPLRLDGLQKRLDSAAGFYRQALAAEAAGDIESYRENLRQTVRLARDYEDAEARLKNLPQVGEQANQDGDG